ncbi:uracil-DNA glycosylase family protein [Halobacteriales archaeon Cl-PHB]
MEPMANNPNPQLEEAESGISCCNNFPKCSGASDCQLSLSSIEPGDERRGSRDPQIAIVTEAPDETSSEGSAYSGGISDRIVSLFCEEEYGIGLSGSSGDSFSQFLREKRIYATSAIKCYVTGDVTEVGDYVTTQCYQRYLEDQIQALPNLELIIPMGNVASAAFTSNAPSSVGITSLVGMDDRGIITDHDDYDVPIVLLPHPSGNNPYANPPIIDPDGNPRYWSYRERFQKALIFIRDTLDGLGYGVSRNSPSSWDSDGGLSDFM